MRKQDHQRSCESCGKPMFRQRYENNRLEDYQRFLKRTFCSNQCAGKARRNKSSEKCACRNARNDAAKQGLLKTACEMCGKCSLLDLHHKDGNRENNTADNLMTLCKRCHAKWHWSNGWKPKPKATCSVCGGPAKGKGLCQKHFRRFKKYGDPLMVQVNRRLQKVSPSYSRLDCHAGTSSSCAP